MRVGRLVNLIVLGGGIALVLGPIADAQLNRDGVLSGGGVASAGAAGLPGLTGDREIEIAALDPETTGSIRVDTDPVAAGWAEFSAPAPGSQQAERLATQAALLSSVAALVPAQPPHRVIASSLGAEVPQPVTSARASSGPAFGSAMAADYQLAQAPVARPATPSPLNAPLSVSPAAPSAPAAESAPTALPTAPPVASPLQESTLSAPPAASSRPGLAGGATAEPVSTTPRATDNQPTVGQLPEPDDKALRYFAQQGDMRRLETEIQRLRALYPNWQPPRDLLEPQAQQMEDQLVQRLWDLYGQSRFSEIREAIAQRQVQDPSWKPPADLIAKMDEAEARERIVNASDQQQWRQVLQIAQRNPQLLVCDSIDILWRVAEAFAKTDRDDRALDVYAYVLQNCDETGDRVSSMEKARELLPSDKFDTLFQYERKTAEGAGEFNVIRLDMARIALGKAVTQAGSTVDPQTLALLEEEARKSNSADDATLVGWYLYSNNDPGQALEWFDFARSHGGDAKASQGAVLSLQRLERFADAEKIGFDTRKQSPDVMTAYLNAVSSWLASPGPPYVPEATLQRFAGVVADEKSPLGARSLGWYALNTGQVPTAIAWFETSLTWDVTEDAAFGLGLAAQRIGDRGRFDLVLRTYAPRFPKLPGMFAEAFRPQPPELETGGQGVITPDGRIFFPARQQAPRQVAPPSASRTESPYAQTVAAAFPQAEAVEPTYAVAGAYPAAGVTGSKTAGLTPAQVVMTTQTGTLPVQPLGSGYGYGAPGQAMGYADTVPGAQAAAGQVQVAQATTMPGGYVAVPGYPQPLVPVQAVPPGYVEVANPAGPVSVPATVAPGTVYQSAPQQMYPVTSSGAAPARAASGVSTSNAASCVARTEQAARTGRISAGDALNRGWCLMELNRPSEAAKAFEMAQSRSHGNKTAEDAAYGLSLAYLRLGVTQNAAVAATKARQTPQRQANLQAQILSQRAVSAYNAGRCSEVFLALDERARLVPENRDLMLLRGWCYYNSGDVSSATKIFQALDQSVSTAESRSGTAEAFDVINRRLHHY